MKTKVKGRFAGVIGAKYHKLFKALPHLLDVEKQIAKEAGRGMLGRPARSLRILDLGCGTGETTLALCEEVSNASIVGIDSEPDMFRQYREMIREQKVVLRSRGIGVVGYQNDALEYLKSCKAKSFDVVVSGYVLHNLPKSIRHEIVIEIARVLDPKGKFVNGDKITHNDEALHQKALMGRIAAYAKTYRTKAEVAFGLGWVKHDIQDDADDQRLTEYEVRSSLATAGFGRIRIVKRVGLDAIVIADRL